MISEENYAIIMLGIFSAWAYTIISKLTEKILKTINKEKSFVGYFFFSIFIFAALAIGVGILALIINLFFLYF